jgi:hypothetical protein
MARWVRAFAGTTLLLLAAVQASHGQAERGADFYQGKTLRIVISMVLPAASANMRGCCRSISASISPVGRM